MPTINLPKKKDYRVPTIRKREYQDIYQDVRWKRLRDLKIKNDPLCERCENEKHLTPATEVHHNVPFDWGRDAIEIEMLAYDYDNLISLCTPCHDKAHDILRRQNMKEKWLRKTR